MNKKSTSVPHFPSPAAEPVTTLEWFDILEDYEIKAAFFVGTPVGIKPIKYYGSDVKFSDFDFDWDKIRRNAKRFVAFHSDNDPYVGLNKGRKLAEELRIRLNFIPNSGHFNAEAGYTQFPDLLKEIMKEELIIDKNNER